jgi:hypothetical protein
MTLIQLKPAFVLSFACAVIRHDPTKLARALVGLNPLPEDGDVFGESTWITQPR